MTDPTNPSQEEPKQGVFESSRGVRSRDPDVLEEPAKTETTEPTEAAKEPAEAAKPDDGRLGKALQRAAQLERQINQLGPWAQFGMAVGNDPKGKAIADRYQKGVPLFVGDEEDISSMTASEVRDRNEEKPLTRQELADYMQQKEAAAQVASDLNTRAEEELPEFRKISKGREFVEMLDWARQAVWNGSIPLDESAADMDNDYAAKEYTALKRAYTMRLASDPKVLEAAKKAGIKQAKERAEEAAAVPSSTTTTTSSQEEPGEKTEAEDLVQRMVNARRGGGKGFASIGRKR
jgi:hypothetical protein